MSESQVAVHVGQQGIQCDEFQEGVDFEKAANLFRKFFIGPHRDQPAELHEPQFFIGGSLVLGVVQRGIVGPGVAEVRRPPLQVFGLQQQAGAVAELTLEKPGVDLLGEGVQAGEFAVVLPGNRPPEFGEDGAGGGDPGVSENPECERFPGPGGIGGIRVQVQHGQSIEPLLLFATIDVNFERPLQGLTGHHGGVISLPADTDLLECLAVDFELPLGPGKLGAKRVAVSIAGLRGRFFAIGGPLWSAASTESHPAEPSPVGGLQCGELFFRQGEVQLYEPPCAKQLVAWLVRSSLLREERARET